MNDEQLLRYSRHILMPQLDYQGQQQLLDSHALIIGLGGLGSPVALYLAAAGLGHLTLVDDDQVELSNLQRQIIHSEQMIGVSKVDSAIARLKSINSEIKLAGIAQRLDKLALSERVAEVDVVIDCSDNFATRFLLNEVTQSLKVPLVSGAAIRMEGQVAVYDPRAAGGGCYRCLYQDEQAQQQTCSQRGVLAPLLGLIGSIQAIEAIKLITDVGESIAGRLLILDVATMTWRDIRLKPKVDCPVCQDSLTN